VHEGIELDHYTVLDEADDVVDLSRALHLHRVNLQAVWDGARVALAVAREAPELLRSLFLVDPEVPRSSFMADPVSSLGAAFDRYVALCKADLRCDAAYPNLAQAFRDDVARQAAHPQTVVPTDVVSGVLSVFVAQPPVFVDGDRLAQGLAAALTSSMRNMPLVAAGVAHPNATLNASLALAQNFPLVVRDFAWGGFLSRFCSYEIHTRSVGTAVAATARPEFAGYDDPAFAWTCAAWPVPEVQQAAFAPVSSDTPTLVVEQQLDPRWQPDTEAQLRAGLTHLSVLSFPTLPGGAVPGDYPSCYNDLRRRFVRDPGRALDTQACGRRSPRINFVVPTT
jgi:pimeloyl-ACP methyl ester carboxylesterase